MGAIDPVTAPPFRRDRFTWAAYGALLAFGYLNAVLGPALPYLGAAERISYLVGALHQFAYALGGGIAGLLATRGRLGRTTTIRVGLAGAAVAGLVVGFGDRPQLTVPAALFMGCLNTLALIALWAALADAHGPRRAVAMTEGEVAVSLGGIIVPLLIAGLAATVATWRFAFVIAAALVALAVVGCGRVRVPDQAPAAEPRDGGATGGERRRRPSPILVIVFAIVGLEFGLSFWLATYLDVSVGLDRGLAVALVAALYGANLGGRLLASRLARRMAPDRLLALALGAALAGLPVLLLATTAPVAIVGFVTTGVGIGALFPLASALHVADSPRSADAALGQVQVTSAIGSTLGPLSVALIGEAVGLRTGLLVLPALVVLAAGALAAYESPRRAAATATAPSR